MTIDEVIEKLKEFDIYSVIVWLEELKELRKLKETYAKGMETSYAEFRYKQGRADATNEIHTELITEIAMLNETKMTDADLYAFAVRVKEITDKLKELK